MFHFFSSSLYVIFLSFLSGMKQNRIFQATLKLLSKQKLFWQFASGAWIKSGTEPGVSRRQEPSGFVPNGRKGRVATSLRLRQGSGCCRHGPAPVLGLCCCLRALGARQRRAEECRCRRHPRAEVSTPSVVSIGQLVCVHAFLVCSVLFLFFNSLVVFGCKPEQL